MLALLLFLLSDCSFAASYYSCNSAALPASRLFCCSSVLSWVVPHLRVFTCRHTALLCGYVMTPLGHSTDSSRPLPRPLSFLFSSWPTPLPCSCVSEWNSTYQLPFTMSSARLLPGFHFLLVCMACGWCCRNLSVVGSLSLQPKGDYLNSVQAPIISQLVYPQNRPISLVSFPFCCQ